MSMLVELPDGTFTKKSGADIAPADRVVFDGPGAFDSTLRLQLELDAAIVAAGGIEAWRAAAHD